MLCFAVHSPDFRSDAIFIPGLASSLLGFLVLCLNFAFSNRYQWTTAATLGVAASSISSITYLVLVILTQVHISRQQKKSRISVTDAEASLLRGAAPISHAHSQSAERPWYSPRPPSTAQSTDGSYLGHKAEMTPVYYSTRDHSPNSTYQRPSYDSPRYRAYSNVEHGVASPPPGVVRDSSVVRQSSLQTNFTVPGPGEAPVQTIPAPSRPLEEEMTRQQMLRLLVNQTSEQAKKNPGNHTFQIEIPQEMHEALMRGTLDRASVQQVAGRQNDDRGRSRARTGSLLGWASHIAKPANREKASRGSPVRPTVSSSGKQNSTRPLSVQPTPQTAYIGSMWKTREERRQEIEKRVG